MVQIRRLLVFIFVFTFKSCFSMMNVYLLKMHDFIQALNEKEIYFNLLKSDFVLKKVIKELKLCQQSNYDELTLLKKLIDFQGLNAEKFLIKLDDVQISNIESYEIVNSIDKNSINAMLSFKDLAQQLIETFAHDHRGVLAPRFDFLLVDEGDKNIITIRKKFHSISQKISYKLVTPSLESTILGSFFLALWVAFFLS